METIVEGIVEKCIQNELIEESQRDWMTYSLQRKFMNFGGFFILVCFGALVAPLPQVILLNFGLSFFTRKDKWTSYANNIFLLYHLFIL